MLPYLTFSQQFYHNKHSFIGEKLLAARLCKKNLVRLIATWCAYSKRSHMHTVHPRYLKFIAWVNLSTLERKVSMCPPTITETVLRNLSQGYLFVKKTYHTPQYMQQVLSNTVFWILAMQNIVEEIAKEEVQFPVQQYCRDTYLYK